MECGGTTPLWLHGAELLRCNTIQTSSNAPLCRKSGYASPQSKLLYRSCDGAIGSFLLHWPLVRKHGLGNWSFGLPDGGAGWNAAAQLHRTMSAPARVVITDF